MILRSISTLAAVAALVTGCYVQSADDRMPQAGDANKSKVDEPANASECGYAVGKGCFSGTVVAKKEFFVDGKTFFNADELASRFSELLTVESVGQQLTAGEDGYQLTLMTPVDNGSFYSGFEYDLTGDAKRAGKLRNDGNFNVNDLPQGTFDLRVSKSVRFKLAANVAKTVEETPVVQPQDPQDGTVQPAEPAQPAEPETVLVEKTYCATLYSDNVVEVNKGKRMPLLTINDYKLHVTDSECAAGGNTTELTLNPK